MNNSFKHRLLILAGVLSLFTGFIYASGQDDAVPGKEQAAVHLLVRAMPDSVMLRWAPDNYLLWITGNRYGYKVTRSCLIRNGEFVEDPETEILTPVPLKPLPLEEWEPLAGSDDYAGVAAEAIYGDGFEVDAGYAGIMDIVNKATEQENRFGFALLAADLSREVALASGLMFVDRDARKGEKYIYRVFPAQVPEGMSVDTGYYFTGVDEYMPLASPVNLKAEAGDKSIMLTWDAVSQQRFFTAFWVERSDDGGQAFNRLDDTPVINTTPEGFDESRFHFYLDSIGDNNRPYHYRVLGVTPFGEVSPPSAVVKTKGVNEINSVPRIIKAESVDGITMDLEWEYELLPGEVADGLRLLRSRKFESEYEIIADSIPVIQQKYSDSLPLLTAYYRLQAFNSDGEGPLSTPKMVQMVDSIPPAAPRGLTAKADTSGVVLLSWDHNGETDLFGYRIFRANSRNEEFSQLTVESVYHNYYSDTISLHTLAKKVYYKILAVDQRQNWSAFSEVLEVNRPDVVPPAPPRISSVRSVDNGIEVSWVLSPSSDVEQQLLYRNNENNRQWQLIKIMDAKTTQFVDSMVLPDILNRYLFVVVDSAGNESKPGKAVGGKVSALKLEEVKDLEVELDKNENIAKLKWTYQRNDVVFFIYKKKGNNSELISSTESKFFFDELLSGSHDVSYAIVVKSSHSGMSGFSEFVSFNKKK